LPFTSNKRKRGYKFYFGKTESKRNPTSIDVANLVEEISKVGLGDAMQKSIMINHLKRKPRA